MKGLKRKKKAFLKKRAYLPPSITLLFKNWAPVLDDVARYLNEVSVRRIFGRSLDKLRGLWKFREPVISFAELPETTLGRHISGAVELNVNSILQPPPAINIAPTLSHELSHLYHSPILASMAEAKQPFGSGSAKKREALLDLVNWLLGRKGGPKLQRHLLEKEDIPGLATSTIGEAMERIAKNLAEGKKIDRRDAMLLASAINEYIADLAKNHFLFQSYHTERGMGLPLELARIYRVLPIGPLSSEELTHIFLPMASQYGEIRPELIRNIIRSRFTPGTTEASIEGLQDYASRFLERLMRRARQAEGGAEVTIDDILETYLEMLREGSHPERLADVASALTYLRALSGPSFPHIVSDAAIPNVFPQYREFINAFDILRQGLNENPAVAEAYAAVLNRMAELTRPGGELSRRLRNLPSVGNKFRPTGAFTEPELEILTRATLESPEVTETMLRLQPRHREAFRDYVKGSYRLSPDFYHGLTRYHYEPLLNPAQFPPQDLYTPEVKELLNRTR